MFTFCKFRSKTEKDKTDVINDPLGQTHSHASSEHCFLLFNFSRFEKWGRTDMCDNNNPKIPTGRDFGLAEWINYFDFPFMTGEALQDTKIYEGV